ncbi:MAG: hypothetical protein WBA67_09105 [Jannaschia sp.]
MSRALAPFVGAVLLSGCVATEPVAVIPSAARPADVTAARAHIRATGRKPDTMRFRGEVGFETGQGDHIICGEYAATGRVGEAVGFTTYYARLRGGQIEVAHFESGQGVSACRNARNGLINVPARP